MPAKGVQIVYGGEASGAVRASEDMGRAIAAMRKQAESGAAAMEKLSKRLDDVGKQKEPGQTVAGFDRALLGLGGKLAALVGPSALLAAFTQDVAAVAATVQGATSQVEALNAALQTAARVAGGDDKLFKAIRAKGEEIAITTGLAPAVSTAIAAKHQQEFGTLKGAENFALAQTRLGVSGVGAIDIAGKLSENFKGLSSAQFLAGATEAAKLVGGDPSEVIALLESIGPQAAASGLSFSESIAVVGKAGERTGPKAAKAAATALFNRLSEGVEVERPATAAEVAEGARQGKRVTTGKDVIRGRELLDRRRDLLVPLAAKDENLRLGIDAYFGAGEFIPGVRAAIDRGPIFPDAALPGVERANQGQARASVKLQSLAELQVEVNALKAERDAWRAVNANDPRRTLFPQRVATPGTKFLSELPEQTGPAATDAFRHLSQDLRTYFLPWPSSARRSVRSSAWNKSYKVSAPSWHHRPGRRTSESRKKPRAVGSRAGRERERE